jgi:hypothetical protein
VMEQSETQPFISFPDPGAYMRSPTGNRIAIRADGTQTGGVFSLLETEDVAGAATPPYVHTREDEAYLILKGRYRFRCAEDSGCAPQSRDVSTTDGVGRTEYLRLRCHPGCTRRRSD